MRVKIKFNKATIEMFKIYKNLKYNDPNFDVSYSYILNSLYEKLNNESINYEKFFKTSNEFIKKLEEKNIEEKSYRTTITIIDDCYNYIIEISNKANECLGSRKYAAHGVKHMLAYSVLNLQNNLC